MNAFLLFSIDSVCIKHSCEMCQMFNHHKNRPCNHTFVFARAEIGRHRFARGQGIRNVLIRYVTAFCVLPSFSQIVCDIDAFYVSLPSFNHFQFVGCALTQCRSLSLTHFLHSICVWWVSLRCRTIPVRYLYRLTDDYYEPCERDASVYFAN